MQDKSPAVANENHCKMGSVCAAIADNHIIHEPTSESVADKFIMVLNYFLKT